MMMRQRDTYMDINKDLEKKINEALEQKFFDSSKKVICPICGKELQLKKWSNTCLQVYCTTANCVQETIRGI